MLCNNTIYIVEFFQHDKMKQDHQRVQNMLLSTVSMLCKNGLQFNTELKVEGLIGVTLDNNEVFLVHINEKISSASEDAQITKTGTESVNIVHTDNIQAKRKHSETVAAQKQSVVEIVPYTAADNTEESDVLGESEPGIVSEIPTSPRKRKKISSSGENNAASTEEDSNTSNSIIIKPEPIDDDLILVNAEEGKTRMLKHSGDSSHVLPGNVSSSFVGFGDLSESDSIAAKHEPNHGGNSSIIMPGGAFITGLVKNSAANGTEQDVSWDSISEPLVPGIPVIPGSTAEKELEWASPSGRRKIPTATQGSSQATDMVGTNDFIIKQMQTRITNIQRK